MKVWIISLVLAFFIACRPITGKATLIRAGLSNRVVIVICLAVTALLYQFRFV